MFLAAVFGTVPEMTPCKFDAGSPAETRKTTSNSECRAMTASNASACHVIQPGATTYDGKQGFSYFAGIAAETVGARASACTF